MGARSVKIIRTWKRDGSTNEMSLDAAVCNLLQNDYSQASDIKYGLLQGVVYETEHAVFRLKD